MARNTQPVFIVGTGRSGTRSLFKMIAGAPGVEIHHEYAVLETQKLAAQYYMGLCSEIEAKAKLMETHGAAIYYTAAKIWADSSNKLSWLIEPLAQLFPNSRFLCIVRDGRKVVASFYYKLREEMYDDDATAAMRGWLQSRNSKPTPPPEKRYWWNIPQLGQPFHAEFPFFDRLQRVAYHWTECNRVIIESFEKLQPEQVKIVRLEDLCLNEEILREVIDFVGAPFDNTFLEYLRTPRNVFLPLDFQLTHDQLAAFWPICGRMMHTLGYDKRDSYDVIY